MHWLVKSDCRGGRNFGMRYRPGMLNHSWLVSLGSRSRGYQGCFCRKLVRLAPALPVEFDAVSLFAFVWHFAGRGDGSWILMYLYNPLHSARWIIYIYIYI